MGSPVLLQHMHRVCTDQIKVINISFSFHFFMFEASNFSLLVLCDIYNRLLPTITISLWFGTPGRIPSVCRCHYLTSLYLPFLLPIPVSGNHSCTFSLTFKASILREYMQYLSLCDLVLMSDNTNICQFYSSRCLVILSPLCVLISFRITLSKVPFESGFDLIDSLDFPPSL